MKTVSLTKTAHADVVKNIVHNLQKHIKTIEQVLREIIAKHVCKVLQKTKLLDL